MSGSGDSTIKMKYIFFLNRQLTCIVFVDSRAKGFKRALNKAVFLRMAVTPYLLNCYFKSKGQVCIEFLKSVQYS